MKTKIIAALIGLQIFTHVFYFKQVHDATSAEVSCQLSRAVETRAIMASMNELNDEYQQLLQVKAKMLPKARLVVQK